MVPSRLTKHVWRILPAEAGLELARVVAGRLGQPPAAVYSLIARGAVFLGERRCTDAQRALRAGQKLVVHHYAGGADAPSPVQPAAWQVAWSDGLVAVVDKPAGLDVIPSRTGGDALSVAVQARWGDEARVLHRIDRDTSGLLLVSCSVTPREMLARQIREHRLSRHYLALTEGDCQAAGFTVEGLLTIDAPLRRGRDGMLVGAGAGARQALTRVRLLRRRGRCTLLQVELTTGRMHQIRAHLASRGLALLGDQRYGGPVATRLGLHAHHLGFVHPQGQRIEVHSPLPTALRALWDSYNL